MKKKGFTLVELLAVIVILAVIALIATPMIMDVIEKARRGAAIESVNGILEAAENYQLESMLEGEEYQQTIDLTSDILTYKGNKPSSGALVIGENNQMSIIAQIGKYCVEKGYDDESPKIIDREDCVGDTSIYLPKPNWSSKSFIDNQVILNYELQMNSFVKETKCYYGKTEDDITALGTNENNTCIYPSEAAYAKVCTTNGKTELCTDTKKLADYLILDGKMLAEFETYEAELTAQEGYLYLDITGENVSRRGAYMKNPIDLTDYAYFYVDISATLNVPNNSPVVNPWFDYAFLEEVGNFGSDRIFGGPIIGQEQAPAGYTAVLDRKIFSYNLLEINKSGVLSIYRNSSYSSEITANIYNIWLQLSE